MSVHQAFNVEITSGALADVFYDGEERPALWPVVDALDRDCIRVVGRPSGGRAAERSCAEDLRGCAGVVSASHGDAVASEARRLHLPVLALEDETAAALSSFGRAVLAHECPQRRYAFYIGRLERDFAQAREAIRVAVESAAGIDFLWIDDGSHATNVEGIRERTQRLLQHAEFVVADLTLGVENPIHENPSRAHEIGMAIAYERPVFLCSQEPRRYPYFSIADMQMSFWAREDELEAALRAWIQGRRHALARRVLNYSLAEPRLREPRFRFDAGRRFVGPNFAEHPARGAGIGP